MILGLVWLLGCQLVGEAIVRLTGAPVPGPVVGMVLLFVVLRLRRAGDDAPAVRAADVLLRHLQLLFIPAGVGVVAYAATLGEHAVPLTLALVGSWLLGLLAVGWTAQLLGRPGGRGRGRGRRTPAGAGEAGA